MAVAHISVPRSSRKGRTTGRGHRLHTGNPSAMLPVDRQQGEPPHADHRRSQCPAHRARGHVRGRRRRRRRHRDEGLQEPLRLVAGDRDHRRGARRQPDVPGLRRAPLRLPRVHPPRQLGVARAGDPLRRGARRPGGGAVGEQPRVVPRLLGHGRPGRDPGGPQRLVEVRRGALRARRLRRQGPGGRPAALRAHRRRRRRHRRRSRRSSSSTPTRPTSGAARSCTASTSCWATPATTCPSLRSTRATPR